MKKINLVMAVLGTVALVSCVKEEFENNDGLSAVSENSIVFKVRGGASTRAGDGEAVTRGVTIPLGKGADGNSFYLEETVANLDAAKPIITRGTPAYTENIGVLYANNMGVYGFSQDVTFETMDDQQLSDGGWRFHHKYGGDPWPEGDETTVDFYLRMPATQTGVTSGYTYGKTTSGAGKITFDYTSPDTATGMQDIVFGYSAISKKMHRTTLPTGVPVLFNHALTGVKFAIGNDTTDIRLNKVAITKIVFSGLYDKGTCTITPASENNGTDNPDIYSSATAAVWGDLQFVSDSLFSGTYTDTVSFAANGTFGDYGKYPDSFAAAGNVRNLGDASASQTFWLIPQDMTNDVKLTIYYSYGEVDNHWTINLGEALSGITWKAGQLRTYTIKIDDVNLMIEDDVDIQGGEDDGFEGSVKSNVTITNTGNTKAFIRAALVGQWLDHNNDPVFGFTDKVNRLYLVESWYEDQFVNEDHEHGVFTGLPGYKESESKRNGYLHNDWQLCTDGYYYYTKVVEPSDTTTALFKTYKVGTIPNSEIAGAQIDNKSMHFTLEIATQAISAISTVTGTPYEDEEWADAWENALGEKPQNKTRQ